MFVLYRFIRWDVVEAKRGGGHQSAEITDCA